MISELSEEFGEAIVVNWQRKRRPSRSPQPRKPVTRVLEVGNATFRVRVHWRLTRCRPALQRLQQTNVLICYVIDSV